MFDIGWTELMVIACVAIIVVGPKDLPRMLRTLGQTMGKVRRMSREFQSTFNDALREAEQQADIADMKKQVESVGNFNPLGDLKKSIEDDFKGKTEDKPGEQKSDTAPSSEPAKRAADEVEAPTVAVAVESSQASKTPVSEENKA